MPQSSAMDELVKNLRRLDSAAAAMTFGELTATELTGQPLIDRILVETWRSFVTVQVRMGNLTADLPVSETSLVHGLTDQGRQVIATYEGLSRKI